MSKQLTTTAITAALVAGAGYLGLELTGPYFICQADQVKVVDYKNNRRFVSCGEATEQDILKYDKEVTGDR